MWRLVRGTCAGISPGYVRRHRTSCSQACSAGCYDPVDAQPLIKALFSRWYYSEDRLRNVIKDIPKKSHPWSDLGDSFCYLLCGLVPEMAEQLRTPKKVTVVTQHGPGQ